MRDFWKSKLLLEDASGYYAHVTIFVCHDCHVKSSSTVLLGELGGIFTAIRNQLREEDLLALENHTISPICMKLYYFLF